LLPLLLLALLRLPPLLLLWPLLLSEVHLLLLLPIQPECQQPAAAAAAQCQRP
jgi:hypothetical protein